MVQRSQTRAYISEFACQLNAALSLSFPKSPTQKPCFSLPLLSHGQFCFVFCLQTCFLLFSFYLILPSSAHSEHQQSLWLIKKQKQTHKKPSQKTMQTYRNSLEQDCGSKKSVFFNVGRFRVKYKCGVERVTICNSRNVPLRPQIVRVSK